MVKDLQDPTPMLVEVEDRQRESESLRERCNHAQILLSAMIGVYLAFILPGKVKVQRQRTMPEPM
jgi:hypothetical protein